MVQSATARVDRSTNEIRRGVAYPVEGAVLQLRHLSREEEDVSDRHTGAQVGGIPTRIHLHALIGHRVHQHPPHGIGTQSAKRHGTTRSGQIQLPRTQECIIHIGGVLSIIAVLSSVRMRMSATHRQSQMESACRLCLTTEMGEKRAYWKTGTTSW